MKCNAEWMKDEPRCIRGLGHDGTHTNRNQVVWESDAAPWEQEELMFAVGIDETHFLAWKGDEWTARALFARRFSKIHEAVAAVERLQEQYPSGMHRFRVLKLWMGFRFKEAV